MKIDLTNYDIICFDFDGVICDSANIKTKAYNSLFIKNYPDKIKDIEKYHIQNAGITRYIKLKYMWKNIIKEKYTAEIENKLIEEYESKVFKAVLNSEFVNNIVEFLELIYKKYKLYIISGTPISELNKILEYKKITKYFLQVFGGEKDKIYWIKKVMEDNDSQNILFFGDAESDFEAARNTNIDFCLRKTGENIELTKLIKKNKIIDFKLNQFII